MTTICDLPLRLVTGATPDNVLILLSQKVAGYLR